MNQHDDSESIDPASSAQSNIQPNSQPERFEYIVSDSQAGTRLDAFVAERRSECSRVHVRRAITGGEIQVDAKNAKPAYRLKPGQIVSGAVVADPRPGPEPEDIDLDVLFEDEHMAAINKPSAMVVHPSKGHWSGTLASAVSFRFQNLSSSGGPTRPGIVHRLDRDTSGVILIAKHDQAHLRLSEQFAERTVKKEYFAIVSPAPDRDRDRIEKMIGIHPYQREKMAVREGHSSSRHAESFYEVTERFGRFALVNVAPKTGRTHQIRVHLASIGCPVLCDKLYSGRAKITEAELHPGNRIPPDSSDGTTADIAADTAANTPSDSESSGKRLILTRQALHARRISFDHPATGERITIEAPLAEDLQRLIDRLKSIQN